MNRFPGDNLTCDGASTTSGGGGAVRAGRQWPSCTTVAAAMAVLTAKRWPALSTWEATSLANAGYATVQLGADWGVPQHDHDSNGNKYIGPLRFPDSA